MIQSAIKLWGRYSHINWAMVDQMMVSGANFLMSILLARFLGVEEFGRFTLAWIPILFFSSIQHAAIASPMMSIGPKQSDTESPAYFSALLVQTLIYAGLGSFLLFVGLHWMNGIFPAWHLDGVGFPLAVASFAALLQEFFRRYFFTKEQPNIAFINDSIRYLGQMAILTGLFLFSSVSMDTAKVLWVVAALSLTASALGIFFFDRIEFKAVAFKETFGRHWHFSKWLTGSALITWLAGNVFIVGAGALLGASAVGALKATQSLMGIVHILHMGLENIAPITAVKHFYKGGKTALKSYLNKVTLVGGGATLVVSTIAIIIPELLLGLIFGQKYQGYGFLLKWYAIIYFFVFISLSLHIALRTFERTQPIFWAKLWASCFSVITVYPLIMFYGLSGVMVGLLGIQLIIYATLILAVRKEMRD
jgi:O-antigen/teichoic acid export membrane protein